MYLGIVYRDIESKLEKLCHCFPGEFRAGEDRVQQHLEFRTDHINDVLAMMSHLAFNQGFDKSGSSIRRGCAEEQKPGSDKYLLG